LITIKLNTRIPGSRRRCCGKANVGGGKVFDRRARDVAAAGAILAGLKVIKKHRSRVLCHLPQGRKGMEDQVSDFKRAFRDDLGF
jgi:hypothetical protein